MQEIQPITKITNHTKQDTGAHILYIFNEINKYIGNAVSFIMEGLVKNEVVLFVDSERSIAKVKDELNSKGFQTHHFQHLIFADSSQTYLVEDQFDVNRAGMLIEMLQPYFDENYKIRTWGQVLVPQHEYILERLRTFECHSDHFIGQTGLISVCAYNGLTTPAYIQNELMKTHNYFMTDSEYSLSPLYNRDHIKFPSGEELERLRRLEKQNKELQDQNDHLTLENKLIAQNEQKVRTIIDHMPIPVIIRRDADILFLNGVAQKKFSIGNRNIAEENHLHQFFEKYDSESAVSDDKKVHQHQLSFKNGKKTYYLVKSIDMIYEGEAAILHSFVDITHEKETEKRFIRSEKLNIAGELAAGIAHELRNPLTAIKGFFSMLKTTNERKEMYYTIIEDELSRIEQISSELLTLAKPHSDNRKIHNIVQLIHEVVILLTPQANMDNIEIILQSNSKELYINCEDTKIKQVFINLIKNAMDAMNDGGNITLKINEMKEHIQVLVIDQGSGIPQEILNKIGEPFYTTKEKGTGIGLMVCFQIIESHDGTIQVDSTVDVGTTFTITLPALREA
ncbi:ATP-binding protein [Paenibacillus allorhizosphaerae]|uniref:Adaptive-response sensory-kinase SasA n=1 Tax=Paenibacillus allorhizosphaerae TaxID=2849866 RepID=A0ABN7TED8_9BACL|nr:ATP-binding protein [Paenibacillus allorhizosphaerae]CAG7614952.1 Adaptive-response sensory-kinase SasA [Paenibacillus allorhizosphaerae]